MVSAFYRGIKRRPFAGGLSIFLLFHFGVNYFWPEKYLLGFYSIGSIAHAIASLMLASSLFFFYWAPAYIVLIILLIFAFYRCENYPRQIPGKLIASDKAFLIFTALFIVLLRWPMLSLVDSNPDESTAISGAMTLVSDPVFWRSVDGGSQGPIVHYLLLLPKLFLMRIDFGAAKLVGLGLNIFTTLFFFSFFKNILGQKLARISVLPLAVSIGLLTQADFIAYNSEHAVLLFISLSLYLMTKLLHADERRSLRIAATLGVVLGCIPFVKLQGVPMALVVALSAYGVLFFRSKGHAAEHPFLPYVLLTLGGFIPLMIEISLLSVTGTFGYFWDNYILGNLSYSSRNDNGMMLTKFIRFARFSIFPEDYIRPVKPGFYQISDFFQVVGTLSGVALIFQLLRWRYLKLRHLSLLVLSIAIGAAGFYAVAQPGNLFPHYLLLLLVPFTLACGVIFWTTSELIKEQKLRSALQIILCIILVIHPFQNQLLNGSSLFSYFKSGKVVEENRLVKKILTYASPGEKMIIWGWASRYYVWTGLIQGSRFGSTVPHIQPQFIPSLAGKKKMNLEILLHDFETSKAPIFLDAVGTGNFAFQDRTGQGHEIYGELRDYVQQVYQLVDDIDGTRLYVRKDRLNQVEKNRPSGDNI